MSTLPIVFKDELQLLAFAEEFIVKNRFASLENDVNRCIPLPLAKLESTGYAPFPALMYCFSVIDLLGSLVAGNARSGKNTDNAARYMETYLDIPKDKVRLLQKICRHKLVICHSQNLRCYMINKYWRGNMMKIFRRSI